MKTNHLNVQQCQRPLSYNEMRQLLVHSPCALHIQNNSMVSKNELKLRTKRDDTPATANHVFALQSTINDHRTIIDDHHRMINYLMNNTVNITQLNQYYTEQHSKITPHWKSWRDISLLLLMVIFICAFIYLLASRFRPLDALMSILVRRHQTKQQQQRNESMNRKSMTRHDNKNEPVSITTTTPVATVRQDYLRYIPASDSH